MKVANLTSTSLTLLAGDIDCYDWSGVSTPATVLTNQQVNAGVTETYRLEPSTNSERKWTMGLQANGTELAGTFRLYIPAGSSALIVENKTEEIVLKDKSDKWQTCKGVKVGADPMATATVDKVSFSSDTVWLWSDGSDIYALSCQSGVGLP